MVKQFAQGHADQLNLFCLCGPRERWGPEKKLSAQHLKKGSGGLEVSTGTIKENFCVIRVLFIQFPEIPSMILLSLQLIL